MEGKPGSLKAARVWMKGLPIQQVAFLEQFSRAMSPDVPVPNVPTCPPCLPWWVYRSQS